MKNQISLKNYMNNYILRNGGQINLNFMFKILRQALLGDSTPDNMACRKKYVMQD